MTVLEAALLAVGLEQTDAEIATALDQSVDLPHDRTLWTYNGVAERLGPEVAEGLAAAMTAAGLTTAVMVYASRGFDLSLDLTRSQLDAIASGAPQLASACEALKLIGRPTQKRFVSLGLPAIPSEAQVAAARERITVRRWWATVQNELINPAIDTASIAELKALVAGS